MALNALFSGSERSSSAPSESFSPGRYQTAANVWHRGVWVSRTTIDFCCNPHGRWMDLLTAAAFLQLGFCQVASGAWNKLALMFLKSRWKKSCLLTQIKNRNTIIVARKNNTSHPCRYIECFVVSQKSLENIIALNFRWRENLSLN
jgi:hypothetical protein